MNIELDEVVVQVVSDDALELTAGGAEGFALLTWPIIPRTMYGVPC